MWYQTYKSVTSLYLFPSDSPVRRVRHNWAHTLHRKSFTYSIFFSVRKAFSISNILLIRVLPCRAIPASSFRHLHEPQKQIGQEKQFSMREIPVSSGEAQGWVQLFLHLQTFKISAQEHSLIGSWSQLLGDRTQSVGQVLKCRFPADFSKVWGRILFTALHFSKNSWCLWLKANCIALMWHTGFPNGSDGKESLSSV